MTVQEKRLDELTPFRGLDEQKKQGKAIFGSAYLVSERVKAEKEKAERWQLSPKEYEIVRSLEKK